MQREQRALLELQRFERIAALERRIFEYAFAAFDQVEQQLMGRCRCRRCQRRGRRMRLPKLPSRSGLLPRRSRQSFRRLTPARPQKAREAAMDTAPFAASTKLPKHPDGSLSKEPSAKLPKGADTPAAIEPSARLPKRRLSAAERLRRLEEAMAFLRQHLASGPQPARALLTLPEPQELPSARCIGPKTSRA